MKRIFTICTALFLVGTINAQQVSFCDDFEGYQNGDPIAQTSTDWETWGSISAPTPPYADDANVINTQASSGDNSLYFVSSAGGPQDVVLPFGSGAPYTLGDFEFTQNMYVTQGTGAYFNFQAETTPGTTWSMDVQMDNTGNVSFENGGGATVFLTTTYPMGVWFEMKVIVDLTNNNWEIFIDGTSQGSFSNTVNKIASLDLYPLAGHDFYVDDVCYTYIPYIPLAYDMKAISLDMASNVALSSAPFTVAGDIVSVSSTTINSLDINYSINGGTPVVDNLIGLNLLLFDTLSFNHTITWTPPNTGSYLVEIWASNLNGNPDMDPTNDIFSDSIHVWNAIAVRQPLIETFTSSTCGPCNPANVTAEALFAQNSGKFTSIKYQADFPGSGDPYYTLEGGNRRAYYAINSVPRMEIDGGWDQNGNSINQQVLDDHIDVLSFVNLTATYSVTGQTVDIDIIVDPLENIQSNNLVVHSAIIEEVTYNNVKNNGETQFEHVVKKMVPNDNGTSISTLVAGQQNTLNLQYIFQGNYSLPVNATAPINDAIEHSVEDFGNLMVAVWVQDVVTKKVHQSTMATLSSFIPVSFNCVNNSCVDPLDGTGTYTSLSNCETICNTTSIEENTKEIQFIYPNPATDNIYISNLKEENTLVKIYDINGRLVLENKVSNKEYLNISTLSKGMYQVKFEGNDWNETRKLIKE